MEMKTKIEAQDGRQELTITREFDLPVELLFRAYTTPQIVEQWMGTKVIKLDNEKQGGYLFETTGHKGMLHRFSGAIHNIVANELIIRTFEMEGTRYGVQLEFLEFESLSAGKSKLNMHVVYRSVAIRDQILQLPFAYGINMAHNRLEEVLKQSDK